MKITTKFNYGDEVYYMKDNKPTLGVVTEVILGFTYSGYTGSWGSRAYPLIERYAFEKKKNNSDWLYIEADLIFPSKEELLKSL